MCSACFTQFLQCSAKCKTYRYVNEKSVQKNDISSEVGLKVFGIFSNSFCHSSEEEIKNNNKINIDLCKNGFVLFLRFDQM